MQLHVSIRIPVLQAWLICWTSALCIPTNSSFGFGRVTITFFHVALSKVMLLGASKDEESSVFPWLLLTVFSSFGLLPGASWYHTAGEMGSSFLLRWNILAGGQEVWPLVDSGCWGFVVPKLLTENGLLVRATLLGSSLRYRLDVLLPSHQNAKENYQWTNRGNTVNQIILFQRTASFCHFQNSLSTSCTLTFALELIL